MRTDGFVAFVMPDNVTTTYGERLLWAMKEAGLSQSELARRIGVKPQSIQHLVDPKKNAQGSSKTAALANVLDVSSHWLETGEGEAKLVLHEHQRELMEQLRAALEEAHPLTARPTGFGKAVAHLLSQVRYSESLPRLKWEDLMTADLNRPFELEVIDDALAPEIFKGCIAVLDWQRLPEPAWPVLVRDRSGNFYLRDYEEGPAGRWRAVARARGYAPLDSEADGLLIVAAMEGYKRPKPPLVA